MTMVDSIKVYGKTKDSFGWPEDNEESAVTNTGHANGTQASSAGTNNEVNSFLVGMLYVFFLLNSLFLDGSAGRFSSTIVKTRTSCYGRF